MFRAYIMLIQAPRLINGQLNHFLSTGSQANFPRNDAVSMTNNRLERTPCLLYIDTKLTEYPGSNSLLLTNKPKQKMFRSNIIMLKALSLFLCKAQNLPRLICKLIKPIPATAQASSHFLK